MTLQQLSNVKHWLQDHRRQHAVEYQIWDLVLTCWVLGWVGIPAAVVLAPRIGLAVCALLACVPELYCWLRRRLHRRGVLRCDWLACAA